MMRMPLTPCIILLSLLTVSFSEAVHVCSTHDDTSTYSHYDTDHHCANLTSLTAYDSSTAVDTPNAWTLYIQRGSKLLQGMKSSDSEAGTLYALGSSAESPYDGDLHSTIAAWGYNDNSPSLQKLYDKECNMNSASGHMLKTAFDSLGMDTKSKAQGGPNECFRFEHYDSPAVILKNDKNLPPKKEQLYKSPCDQTFRMTGAEHTVGVNAAGGAIFAIDITSPAKAARSLWRRAPEASELPHIRSFSDIAWAAWNRASTPETISNIRYLFVTMVINSETNRHVKKALSTLDPPLGDPALWPGSDFSMDGPAGQALLGSPVGRRAGYFLMRHKRQLGGSRWIEKVRVFKSGKEGSLPYLLFYVNELAEGTKSDNVGGEVKVTREVRRWTGSRIVWEYVFRAAVMAA